MPNNIAVLCCANKSIYREIEGVDCYGIKENARSYTGSNPVIAHPPCRGYSAFMRHWSKPVPGEKDLALFCTERIRINGGVLEHPAHSRYVKRFIGAKEWKIIEVHQSWFGYPVTKKTWLLMPHWYDIPELPFSLVQQGREKEMFEHMSKDMRSHTTENFAKWLIKLVRINQ